MKGRLVIISAPSGAGKTTIVRFLLSERLNLEFSVSATTRKIRNNETEGKDYYFLSVQEFRRRIDNGDFAEWEEVYKDHYYGYDDVRLGCIAMETGERAWSGERYGGQLTCIEAMEMLLVLSERGDLARVRAVPDRFEEVARFKALTGKTWNHPIIHRGRLYIRNSQESACFELPGLVAVP